jgi:prepilin-type processing-associated H-X9-DG protein
MATDPTVTVLGNGNGTATTNPNNQTATGGTHGNRTRINALFADLHCESMTWNAFTSTTASVAGQPDQWTPYSPYP